MKLCGSVNWCKIGWLVVLFNLLFSVDTAWSQYVPPNFPPVVNWGISNQHAQLDSAFSFTFSSNAFRDNNVNDQLTYSAEAVPASSWPSWLVFDPATRHFSGTPNSVNSYFIKVTARDPLNETAEITFKITVHSKLTPYVAFSSDYQMGCQQRRVTFTVITNLPGALSYSWDFGNGNSSYFQPPVAANYDRPGEYSVRLTVKNPPGPDLTWDDKIYIYPNPLPDADASPLSGCEPLDVTLDSKGTKVVVLPFPLLGKQVGGITGGDEKYYRWYSNDFPGQKDFYSVKDTISFNDLPNNKYSVDLTVTDANGCSAMKTFPNLFEVYDNPVNSFIFEKENSCQPSNTKFTRTTQILDGSSIDSVVWIVDGIIYSNPGDPFWHLFTTYGDHPVSLTTFSSNGCRSATLYDTVRFNSNNTADFSVIPQTTCFGSLTRFDDTVSNTIKNLSWDFDYTLGIPDVDSTGHDPSWEYQNPGNYTVRLTATFDDGCVRVIDKNATVDQAVADFTYSYTVTCGGVMTLSLNDKSSASVNSWKWYYRSGLSGWISLTGKNQIINNLVPGNYDVSLVVKNPTGCSDSINSSVPLLETRIDSIVVSGGYVGCYPSDPTIFSAVFNSDYDTPRFFYWDFNNDGTNDDTTTTNTVSYSYPAVGTYSVKVNVITNGGCSYSITKVNSVQLALQPSLTSADVLLVQPDLCYISGIVIDVTLPPGTDSLRFVTADSTIYIQNPGSSPYHFHYHFNEIGTYSIGVVAIDNGCASDVYWVNNIQVNGPKALFASGSSFCNEFDVHFTNQSSVNSGATTDYLWDFGDGNTSIMVSPDHSYNLTGAGTYRVTLIATDRNTGCFDLYWKDITLFTFSEPKDIIRPNPADECANIDVNFDISTVLFSDNFSENIDSVRWDFKDGTILVVPDFSTVTHRFETPGSYLVSVDVFGTGGCTFSSVMVNPFQIRGPVVDFVLTPNPVCSSAEVSFSNTAHNLPGDLGFPEKYYWDFGDGIAFTSYPPGDTVHTYSNDSVYTVSLRVEDSNGCLSDTIKKQIEVKSFEAGFAFDQYTCNKTEVTFHNRSKGKNLNYKWDFGDSKPVLFVTDSVFTYTYDAPGNYNVTLQVTAAGCMKTESRTVPVMNITAEFSAVEDSIGCAPAVANFTPTAIGGDLVYNWDFGDGFTSNDPVHRYYTPGNYPVTLQVLFTNGCVIKSLPLDIYVDGAKGDLSYINQPACSPNEVKFSLSNLSNVDSITWDFGDGNPFYAYPISSLLTEHDTTYAYTNAGFARPSVILTSHVCGSYTYEKFGSALAELAIFTSVPPTAKMGIDHPGRCQGVPITFTDESILNDTVPITSRLWTFMPLSTSTLDSVQFAYNSPGYFAPQLIVSNRLGCSDTISGNINIFDRSKLVTHFDPPNQPVCPYSDVTFNGIVDKSETPVNRWEWFFGDGATSSDQITTHAYSKTLRGRELEVLLIATDSVQCSDSTLRTVDINSLQAALGYKPQLVRRGVSVDFSDSTIFDFDLNSWRWYFEGGNPKSSFVKKPPPIYYDTIRTANQIQLIVSDESGCTDTTLVSLNVMNNPPEVYSFNINALVSTSYPFNPGEFTSHFDAKDPPTGQSLYEIKIVTRPQKGKIYLDGIPVEKDQIIRYSEINKLSYWSDVLGSDSFSWNGSDSLDFAITPASVNILVYQVPPPPTVNKLEFNNIREDSVLSFPLDTFTNSSLFSNYPVFPGFHLDPLQIVTIPTSQQGTLYYNSVPVHAGDNFDSAQIANGVFTVTPVPGYDGSISFYWNGFDSLLWGTPAPVIINYRNAKPVLKDIERDSLKEDAIQFIYKVDEFLKNYSDSDKNDNPTIFLLDIPAGTQGTFKINNTSATSISFDQLNSVTFTPAKGFSDTVEVIWGVSDGQDTSYAYIRYIYINMPPVARDMYVSGIEDNTIPFLTTFFSLRPPSGPFEDEDKNDVLQSISIETLPEHGIIFFNLDTLKGQLIIPSNQIQRLRFKPEKDWFGIDSFQYRENDGTDWSVNDSTVYITITNVNDPPRPGDDLYTILEDDTLSGFNVRDNDTDIDDIKDSLKVSIFEEGTAGENGEITLEPDGDLTYIPNLNFNGTVSFKYRLCDLEDSCAIAKVTIHINPENDPPVALPDINSILETTVSIKSDTTTNLLANDNDIDESDSLFILSVNDKTTEMITSPWGLLRWFSDGSYIYYNDTINSNSLCDTCKAYDVFKYVVSDRVGATAFSNLTITINGVNDNPKAYNDTLTLGENDASAILSENKRLLSNDTDIDGDTLRVIKFNNQLQRTDTTIFGTITWNEYGSVFFKPRNSSVDSLQEDEHVSEKFRYVAADPFGGIDSALLVLVIQGINDEPVALNDTVRINEDIDSIKGSAENFNSLKYNDKDIDNDSLIITLINNLPDKVTGGNYGRVVWDSLGNYTYITKRLITDTLEQNEVVIDSFTYTLTDVNGAKTTAKLIVEITGINDPPEAVPDSNATTDINPIIAAVTDTTHVLYNDWDVDGHTRTVTAVNGDSNSTARRGRYGLLSWNPDGSYQYQPDTDFAESLRPLKQVTDTFTYQIKDEFLASDTTLLQLTIVGINNAPTANNDTLKIFEDKISEQLPLPGLLIPKNVQDPDLDTLKVFSMAGSENDSIPGKYGYIKWDSTGIVTYSPYQNKIHQLGSEQVVTEAFTYTVIDPGGLKAHANLIVKIIGQNDSVFAFNDNLRMDEDTYGKMNVVANDQDIDNDGKGNFDYSSLTIVDNFRPRHGIASRNTVTGEIYYHPEKDFNGRDSLKYRICDTGDPVYCDEAWLYIDVIPVNDPPEATPWVLFTPVNTPVSFDALDPMHIKDIDDGINPNSIQKPDIKNVGLTGYTITYTPDQAFTGKVDFTYSVKDSSGLAAYVLVTVIVGDTLSDYRAQNDYISTYEDIPVDISVLENDTIGGETPDPRTVEIKVFPNSGVATFDPVKQMINYQPEDNFYGIDSLTYIVSSGPGNWGSAIVYITVSPVNDPVVANSDLASTFIDTTVVIPILENDYDSDDDGIDTATFQILVPPGTGTTGYNTSTGKLSYTPNSGFFGIDSLVYLICDRNKMATSCDSASVIVLVKSIYSGFSANDDNYVAFENKPYNLAPSPLDNDKNIDEKIKTDPSSFKILSGPQHGSFSIGANYTLTYTPEENYFGPDWMQYIVSDSSGNWDDATINIWVNEVNIPPVAIDDEAIVTKNEFKRLFVLENDYDIDGTLKWSTLDTISGKGPNLGKVQIDKTTGTILYKPSVNGGDDSFTYRICDNKGLCDEATVNITVELDTIIYIYRSTYEDSPDTIDITTELTKYNFNFNITSSTEDKAPELGRWSFINNNTDLVYYPSHDSNGNDAFWLNVCGSQCAYLRIYYRIIPVNDAPVAIDDTIYWTNTFDDKIITFDTLLMNDYDVDGDQILLTDSVIQTGYDGLHVIFNADSTITISADTILWCETWFTYEIMDSDGLKDTAKVKIWPMLAGITAFNDQAHVDENSQSNLIDVLENDLFKDNQRCTIDTVIIITPPKHGTAVGTSDNFIDYTSTRHYFGADSLQYQITDIWGQASTAWVYVTVIEKNSPPVAVDDIVSNFGTVVNIPVLVNDYDPDAISYPDSPGDPNSKIDSALTQLTTEPLYGTVLFNTTTFNFVYTPEIKSCVDSFRYTIFDNELGSDTGTVIINFNEAPIFANTDIVKKTYPGIQREVEPLLNDSGYFMPDETKYTIPQTIHGVVNWNSQNVVSYTSDKGFIGRDSILYTIVSPCGDEKSAWIVFVVEELRVPEIITPNGDGKNDVLIIEGIEYFPDNLLQIFNRYGHVVYQKKGYMNEWGGYSNKGSLFGDKPLPAGTYYYTLIYNEGRNRQAGFIYIFW